MTLQEKMRINTSLHLLPRNNLKRIIMNKMSLTPTFYRLGPALLLFSFLVGGCAGTPAEYRYDDKMKTYTSASDETTATSNSGQHDKATAHYVLRPGNRPDFQPKERPQNVYQPATDQSGAPVTELADLQMVLEVSDILFEFDKWVIKQSVVPELDRWADYFQSHPQVTAEIYGHADSTGPSAYNQQLSQRRAQAVVNYLVAKGVAPNRLTAKGFGESQPAVPNTTDEGRQKNRRVELKL
jgi:outer membrane protein OmpA-like peptidoglycan-associated protein